jgi:hypothetical protein
VRKNGLADATMRAHGREERSARGTCACSIPEAPTRRPAWHRAGCATSVADAWAVRGRHGPLCWTNGHGTSPGAGGCVRSRSRRTRPVLYHAPALPFQQQWPSLTASSAARPDAPAVSVARFKLASSACSAPASRSTAGELVVCRIRCEHTRTGGRGTGGGKVQTSA